MNIIAMSNYIEKVRKSNSKDFEELSKELDDMIEYKVIGVNEYNYLLGFLTGVIDTKLDYNIEENRVEA